MTQEVPSMHEQDGTSVRDQTSSAGIGKTISRQQRAILYNAAMKGDWKAAEPMLGKDAGLASLRITVHGERMLHIAALAKCTMFVRELVKLMSSDEVASVNNHGNTAFMFAAASEVVEIAKVMYERNNGLPIIRRSDGKTPLHLATTLGKKEMSSYLYSITPREILKADELNEIFEIAIATEMFGFAQNMLKEHEDSISLKAKTDGLQILATKPAALISNNEERTWKRYSSITRSLHYVPGMKRIHDYILDRMRANQLVQKLLDDILELPNSDEEIYHQHLVQSGILSNAVKEGNVEFVAILSRSAPELIVIMDAKSGYSIFHLAVQFRQAEVFKLIYETGVYKDILALTVDENQNSILHLAGKLPTRNILDTVSGAALQMQRELQWFKEVEKIVPPLYLKMTNKCEINGKPRELTPREVFSEEHRELLENGEKWMKDTANSCMIIATLIATVVFAAAFTIPGGSYDDTGVPIFLKAGWFELFVVSDAVAMFTSTISIIMFLSILTSRYAEDDFLASLPNKLSIGLTALFVSILTMVVAFTASFFLIYNGHRMWVPKLIGAFACIPVIVFALLQYKLWIDTIRSTYWARFLFEPSKRKLY